MEEMKTPRVCVYVKQSSDGEIVCLINACKGLYLVTSCSHSASWYDRGLVLVTSCSLLLSMIHESLQTKKEGLAWRAKEFSYLLTLFTKSTYKPA